MAANLEIRLLGGLQIKQNGLTVAGFMSSKVPALLAYLAVTGRPHQRDALAGLLWGEMPDDAAANNLRQALTNLRKLAEPHLLITRETVAFNPDAAHFLDVVGFRNLLRLSGGQPIAQRIGLLREALALYRGDFLEGFYVRDAPDFEDWALVQRVQLRELALHGWDKLTELLLNIGDYPGAVDAAGRLLAMDPWREEAHRQRMMALARSGQRSAALAQYQTCRTILQKEFDTEPSAETNALYERIRLAMRGARHNLPALTTGFVGRENELAELLRLLASPTSRLVTLLGPGGVGKTRLALEAAAAAEPAFLNGVWLAQLAGVDNPAALPWSLADAVGLPLAGAEPPEVQLLNFLRHRELLLVLDNFEPLIGKAALDLVWRILQQAPAVKLLITSRERLNLAAEWLVDLAGLPFPAGSGHGDAQAYPAVQLFVRRSHRVRPDFVLDAGAGEAVARICQLTEGLPLAIELAAAWMRTLPPATDCRRAGEWISATGKHRPRYPRTASQHGRCLRTLLDLAGQRGADGPGAALRISSRLRPGCSSGCGIRRPSSPPNDWLTGHCCGWTTPAVSICTHWCGSLPATGCHKVRRPQQRAAVTRSTLPG